MEAAWMLAGIVLGGLVALLFARLVLTGRPRSSSGHLPQSIDPRVSAEFDQLRLEWADTLDRIEHLYDRIRKRARVEESPVVDGVRAAPVLRTPAEVMRRAAELGMLMKGR